MESRKLEDGVTLCLSGGGYRAMLFHVGALWRLYQAGVLPQVVRVSSVSGGSIAAGVLALAWDELFKSGEHSERDFISCDPRRNGVRRSFTRHYRPETNGKAGAPLTLGLRPESSWDL